MSKALLIKFSSIPPRIKYNSGIFLPAYHLIQIHQGACGYNKANYRQARMQKSKISTKFRGNFGFCKVEIFFLVPKKNGQNFHNFRRYFRNFSDISSIFPSKFLCRFLHNLVKISIISMEISEISVEISEISVEISVKIFIFKIFINFL